MDELRTLTTLVPRIAAGTLFILIVATFTTGNNATGNLDKPIYFGFIVVGYVITAIFLHNHRSSRFDLALALLSSLALVWGIGTIERPALAPSGYWLGFGSQVAIGTVVLVVLFGTVLPPQRFPKPLRSILGWIVIACCLCDLIGLIRTIDFIPYVNNNLNEINDLLGPVAGKVPESTFIPEYNAIYGWLFVPFERVLSPMALVGAMAIFFTLLGIATVVLAVLIVRRILGTGGYVLPLAQVVPITLVTSPVAGSMSSIASLFQELPIRLFSGFVVVAVGLTDLVLLYRGTLRPKRLTAIGVLCGVVSWNSQDFGVAAALVFGLMVLASATRYARIRAFGLWIVGLVVGLASYPLFLLAIGSPLKLSFVAVYVELFGSGLGSAPIQVPGPVLIVVPIIFCSTAAGWALMRMRRREGVPADARLDQATVMLALVGTWTTGCLVYYINRAYAPGQLQTMLLPCAVCIAGLLSIVRNAHGFATLSEPRSGRSLTSHVSGRLKMAPVAVFFCLCFSAGLLTTNPIAAGSKLLHPAISDGYTTYDLPQVIAAVDRAQQYTAGRPGELTYLGESFNYVLLVTHVPTNAILFPFPLDAISSVTRIECGYLQDHHSRWMVLSLYGVQAFGSNACGIYRPVNLPGVAFGQLQEIK